MWLSSTHVALPRPMSCSTSRRDYASHMTLQFIAHPSCAFFSFFLTCSFNFAPDTVELYAERVANRGLCADAQAESLRYKLLGGLAVRRACYGVIRFVMEAGAKGAECIVTGKLRGARAKAMKFNDGYMIKTGQSNKDYVRTAVRHVKMRQGVLGLKVSIMLPYDPKGIEGCPKQLSDIVEIMTPKNDDPLALGVPARPQAPAVQAVAAPVAPAQPVAAPAMPAYPQGQF